MKNIILVTIIGTILSGCAALPLKTTYDDEHIVNNTAEELSVPPVDIKILERKDSTYGDGLIFYTIEVKKEKHSTKYKCQAQVQMVAYWWARKRPVCDKIK